MMTNRTEEGNDKMAVGESQEASEGLTSFDHWALHSYKAIERVGIEAMRTQGGTRHSYVNIGWKGHSWVNKGGKTCTSPIHMEIGVCPYPISSTFGIQLPYKSTGRELLRKYNIKISFRLTGRNEEYDRVMREYMGVFNYMDDEVLKLAKENLSSFVPGSSESWFGKCSSEESEITLQNIEKKQYRIIKTPKEKNKKYGCSATVDIFPDRFLKHVMANTAHTNYNEKGEPVVVELYKGNYYPVTRQPIPEPPGSYGDGPIQSYEHVTGFGLKTPTRLSERIVGKGSGRVSIREFEPLEDVAKGAPVPRLTREAKMEDLLNLEGTVAPIRVQLELRFATVHVDPKNTFGIRTSAEHVIIIEDNRKAFGARERRKPTCVQTPPVPIDLDYDSDESYNGGNEDGIGRGSQFEGPVRGGHPTERERARGDSDLLGARRYSKPRAWSGSSLQRSREGL